MNTEYKVDSIGFALHSYLSSSQYPVTDSAYGLAESSAPYLPQGPQTKPPLSYR